MEPQFCKTSPLQLKQPDHEKNLASVALETKSSQSLLLVGFTASTCSFLKVISVGRL